MNNYICHYCEKDLLGQLVIACPHCGKTISMDCFDDNYGLCIDCLMAIEDDHCLRDYMEEKK